MFAWVVSVPKKRSSLIWYYRVDIYSGYSTSPNYDVVMGQRSLSDELHFLEVLDIGC